MKATEEQNAKRRARHAELMRDPLYRKILKRRNRDYREKNSESLSEADRKWRETHREQYRETKRAWAAKNRDKDLECHRKSHLKHIEARREKRRNYSKSHRAEARARESSEYYRTKAKARSRAHYLANKEHYKAKYLARMALQLKATVNLRCIEDFIKSVRAKGCFLCYYCDHFFSIGDLHFDHIVPLSKGGSHSVENLCTSCAGCNLSKHNKPVQAWIRIGQQLLNL